MSDDDNIYLGVWTNYSHGTVMGATLTTTRRYGNLLIAFTGFLIPFVASRFWHIACVLLHYYLSTPNPRDAIHHQRQVILRNSTSPDSGLLSLFRLLGAWRKTANPKGTKRYSRLLPVISFAIFCSAAFTVAAGFSSQISTAAGDVVLLKGNHCGIVYADNSAAANSTTTLADYSHHSEILNDAANYAQQCYSNNTSGIVSCNRFVVQSLSTAISDTNAGCPFQGGMCRSNTSNVRLDTGFIDSNDKLGINAPEDQRFAWRYVLQCAPLVTEGYKSSYTRFHNQTWVEYNYGIANPTGLINFTYEINDIDSQYSFGLSGAVDGTNYKLSASTVKMFHGTVRNESDFTPIPQIFRSDADVAIIFLVGNGVYHVQLLDDEWYRATVPAGGISFQGQIPRVELEAYTPTEAASPLGCTEQWQWCNSAYSRETGCGPLASKFDAIYSAASLFNLSSDDLDSGSVNSSSPTQASLLWPALIQMINSADISGTLSSLGAKSLASQSLLYSGLQYPLPRNQWQLDVLNWWNIILASTQASYINTVVGTTDPDLLNVTLFPSGAQEQKICNNQKVLSTAYSSFNLFGLLFTHITGFLIIIISFVLDPFLKLLHNRYKYKNYAYLEWTTNTSLQLHRLAQEELRMGTWSGADEMIPITKGDDMLASLDVSDLKHPVLTSRPASTPIEVVEPDKTSQHSRDSTQGAAIVPVESTTENTSNEDNNIGEAHTGEHVSHENEMNDGADALGAETHDSASSSLMDHGTTNDIDRHD